MSWIFAFFWSLLRELSAFTACICCFSSCRICLICVFWSAVRPRLFLPDSFWVAVVPAVAVVPVALCAAAKPANDTARVLVNASVLSALRLNFIDWLVLRLGFALSIETLSWGEGFAAPGLITMGLSGI